MKNHEKWKFATTATLKMKNHEKWKFATTATLKMKNHEKWKFATTNCHTENEMWKKSWKVKNCDN